MEEAGGRITLLRQKISVSQHRKTSWSNPIGYQKSSGVEKLWNRRWEYNVSASEISCLIVPKNFTWNHFVFKKFLDKEKNMEELVGVSRFSVGKILSQSAGKYFVFQKVSVMQKNFGRGNGSITFFHRSFSCS